MNNNINIINIKYLLVNSVVYERVTFSTWLQTNELLCYKLVPFLTIKFHQLWEN